VVLVMTVSWRWGSFVAGGSDSYCYLHQAERWADAMAHPFRGRLQVAEPLALEVPWPDAPLSFTPIGHVPSTTTLGAIVPICPAGLSIAMAPLVIAGGPRAAPGHPAVCRRPHPGHLRGGSRFGARIGLASALLTAASPAFLYQAVQPMSDVPAAAMWMVAVACVTGAKPRHLVTAGLATSAAILIRPNLLPLGIVIGLFLLFRPERQWSQRMRDAAMYAACCMPGCLGVALISGFYGLRLRPATDRCPACSLSTISVRIHAATSGGSGKSHAGCCSGAAGASPAAWAVDDGLWRHVHRQPRTVLPTSCSRTGRFFDSPAHAAAAVICSSPLWTRCGAGHVCLAARRCSASPHSHYRRRS
jgi:hypothetical protein